VIYILKIKDSALKQLNKLPKREYIRVTNAINSLPTNPRPSNSIKLTDTINEYRLRVGDYRILYTIENKILTIEVFKVSNRKDAY
jgi:mRNA interferase RelE/StbE